MITWNACITRRRQHGNMPLMRRRQHRKRGEDEGMGTVMVTDKCCAVIYVFVSLYYC